MKSELDIRWVPDAAWARAMRDSGYCPIECSFGDESVVDALQMDHHGSLAHFASVALRAWRDHRGARDADPRFVVTGAADADATFAIASLGGLLPPGSDCGRLVELIAAADTNPHALADDQSTEATLLILWRRMASVAQDATAFHGGVDRWRALLRGPPPQALLDATRAEEVARVAAARTANIERLTPLVAFVESPVWGFDVWYAEVAPVIIAYVADTARATVGARDYPTARALFGPRGLMDVFAALQPPGWGGRETVGGSPRGFALNSTMARSAAETIAKAVMSPTWQNPNDRASDTDCSM